MHLYRDRKPQIQFKKESDFPPSLHQHNNKQNKRQKRLIFLNAYIFPSERAPSSGQKYKLSMNTTKTIQSPVAWNCLQGSKQHSFGIWFFKKKKKIKSLKYRGKDDKILVQTAKAARVSQFSFPLRSCLKASTGRELFFQVELNALISKPEILLLLSMSVTVTTQAWSMYHHKGLRCHSDPFWKYLMER